MRFPVALALTSMLAASQQATPIEPIDARPPPTPPDRDEVPFSGLLIHHASGQSVSFPRTHGDGAEAKARSWFNEQTERRAKRKTERQARKHQAKLRRQRR